MFLLKYGTAKPCFTVPVSKVVRQVRSCREVGPVKLNRINFGTHPISLDPCARKTSVLLPVRMSTSCVFVNLLRSFATSCSQRSLRVCVYIARLHRSSCSWRSWVFNFFLLRDGICKRPLVICEPRTAKWRVGVYVQRCIRWALIHCVLLRKQTFRSSAGPRFAVIGLL